MDFIYDVFIGYHGTYDENGSYAQAKTIADYLFNQGYTVYLHGYMYSSVHSDTPWDQTWERVKESKSFLLVINDYVPKKENGSIGSDGKYNSQLRQELDTFNTMVQKSERDKHDFNWFYCGAYKSKEEQDAFLSNLYIPLTSGHNCLLYGDTDYEKITKWLSTRIINKRISALKNTQDKYIIDIQDDDILILTAYSFEAAYLGACDVCKENTHNLIIRVRLTYDSFLKPFPYHDALVKAEVISGNSPKEDEHLSDVEFALYHGDYIVFENKEKTIDGYKYLINELKQKRTSRRAIISLISSTHIVNSGNKPIPSYMVSQFQIKDNVLYVCEYFRAMEISNFFPINMGESYIIISRIISELTDISNISIVYHIFDGYISNRPQSSLYIPLMDRVDAELDIIPAIKDRDTKKIIELLEDKRCSKIYDIHSGFETMIRCIKKYHSYNQEILGLLFELLDKSKLLESLYEKSNNQQETLLDIIEDLLTRIINLFMKG